LNLNVSENWAEGDGNGTVGRPLGSGLGARVAGKRTMPAAALNDIASNSRIFAGATSYGAPPPLLRRVDTRRGASWPPHFPFGQKP